MNGENSIEARGLTRRYGDLVAVDGVDFAVRRGEVFGFLGPNGAGKTTTVRMLTGYLTPTEGTALVGGHDILEELTAARQHIGVVPEEANVYVDLTVWQNVMLMGELHGIDRASRRQRGRELLELFGLADRAKHKGRTLSKGLRQRLMLCMALVSDPEILFLDEPTSGLDVASARLIRDLMVQISRERQMTVFLTTHNIEEADRLCHRVAIINEGRIAAIDRPQQLRRTVEARRSVELTFTGEALEESEVAALAPGAEVTRISGGYRVYTPQPGWLAQEVASLTKAKGLRLERIQTLAPSLEDVFLHVTAAAAGQGMEATDG